MTDETTHLRALLADATARAEKAEAERDAIVWERGVVEDRLTQALAANAELRAALDNLVALIQRDGLQPDPLDPNAAVRVDREIGRDWACRGCRPDSDVLKDGFLCSYHRAQALLSRTDLGAGKVLVEREVVEEMLCGATTGFSMSSAGDSAWERLADTLRALLKKDGAE